MPEGPELLLSSRQVNSVCKDRIFGGKVVKSAVSRQPEVKWKAPRYAISAVTRGKEVKLILTSLPDAKNDRLHKVSNEKPRTLDIVFQFGMSGRFDFYEAKELVKHAHLNFFTIDEPKMVLSFVDYRRFGRWQVGAGWSDKRGPCVMSEYPKFRENLLNSLDRPLFKKPICEVMLNQQYFNGLGNYLRAEILYRAKIPPFVSARSVLEPLVAKTGGNANQPKIKTESPDFLQLCNLVPMEVVDLGGSGYVPVASAEVRLAFQKWLRCYCHPSMKNMADHNKRTIWYSGPAGPMAPTEVKVRVRKEFPKEKQGTKMEQQAEIKKIKSEEKSENEDLKDVPHVEEKNKESRKRKRKLEKDGNATSDLKVRKHASLTDLKLSDYPADGTKVTRSRVEVILKGEELKQKSSQKAKKALQDEEDAEQKETKIKKRSAGGKRAKKQK